MPDKPERKKRAYCYTRVSTGMQVDGYSLDAQRERIEKYAYGADIELIEPFFSDEGRSGKSIEGRDEFKRMLEYIDAGADVDYVIVFKLSRFGRNAADILSTLQRMQDHGVNLICVEDGIDSSKDSGKLVISVLAAVSEIERENILNQTMAGRREKARQGKWNGGQAPYGYVIEHGELKVVPEAAKHVKMIYQMYLDGLGMANIANRLTDRGYRKVAYKNRKDTAFAPSFVKGVLDNPVYMGKIAYGRRKTEKVEGTRNEYHMVKQDDYELHDGIHEAIIDEATWMRVHEMRLETGVGAKKRYSLNHAHLLSGILKCPICGAGLYGNVNRKKKKDGSGEYYEDTFYYACKHRKLVDGERCSFKRQYPQWRVDSEVLEALMEAMNNNEFTEKVKESLNAQIDPSELENELKGLQVTRRRANAKIKKISEQMDALDSLDDMYDRKYGDMQDRLDAAYKELSRVEEDIRRIDIKLQNLIRRKATLFDAVMETNRIFGEWANHSEQERQEIFRKYIDSVEIFPDAQKDERVVKRIVFKFPVPVMGEPDGLERVTESPFGGEAPYYSFNESEVLGYTNEFRWDKRGHVETICLLTNVVPTH
jgi:site-specific DNA recombinase